METISRYKIETAGILKTKRYFAISNIAPRGERRFFKQMLSDAYYEKDIPPISQQCKHRMTFKAKETLFGQL